MHGGYDSESCANLSDKVHCMTTLLEYRCEICGRITNNPNHSAVTPNSPCTSGTPMPRAQLERVISVEKRMLRCTLAGGLTRFARRRSRTSRDRDPLNHERSRNSSCTSRLHSTHLARAISKNQPAPRYPRSAKRKGWNERVLDDPPSEKEPQMLEAAPCSGVFMLFLRLSWV